MAYPKVLTKILYKNKEPIFSTPQIIPLILFFVLFALLIPVQFAALSKTFAGKYNSYCFEKDFYVHKHIVVLDILRIPFHFFLLTN